MATLRFLFVVTLLAALSLAAPAEKRNLKKRSFIVPRNLNVNHPRGLNGLDAMRKAAMKYSAYGFIDIVKATEKAAAEQQPKAEATNGTKNTGKVKADPQQNGALFLSPVEIGGQQLNLDFDSGSSDLWVFSTGLSKQAIGGHAAFDPAKSKSFKNMTGSAWTISYGDGSGAAGTVGTDTVNIGGATVTNQAVEMATAVSQSFQRDTNTDGLVGLAFSKLNTVTTGNQKTPQKTFFDNVMKDLPEPLFTADLAVDGSGSYQFGAVDQSKISAPMQWVPVNASSGFWQVESKKFSVNGKVFDNPTAGKAIADTGTSLLLVDQKVAETYYSQVQGAQLNQQVGGFVYPCNAKLPDMEVALGNYMAKIPGSVVTFAQVDQANTTCFGGIQGNQGAGLQIFGDTMFRSQLVAFNGGNQSLGLAPKKGIA